MKHFYGSSNTPHAGVFRECTDIQVFADKKYTKNRFATEEYSQNRVITSVLVLYSYLQTDLRKHKNTIQVSHVQAIRR